MKPRTVEKVGEVEVLLAGLVVHHPHIGLAALLHEIHPIHEAGDFAHGAFSFHRHRRQRAAVGKGELTAHRLELAPSEFLAQVVHDVQHLGAGAAEEMRRPLRLLGKPRRGIAIHLLHGDFPQALGRHGYKAALLPHPAHRLLQHGVDKGAEGRGIQLGLLPGRGLEAVGQEVRQAAAGEFVDPGGREIELPAIEPPHRLGGKGREVILPPPGKLVLHLGQSRHILALAAVAQVPGREAWKIQKDLLLPRRHGLREQRRRPAEEPGRLLPGVGKRNGLLGSHKRRGDAAHLLIHLVGAAGRQRNALGQELAPLGLGDKPLGALVGREGAVRRTQHQKVLRAPLPEVCEGAGIDLVEPGGDGAHLVLGEQRPPQAAKAIAAPWHGAQGEVHLLHTGAEDVVELGKLLRQLSLSGGGAAGGLLREAGAQCHGLEEILQRQHHLAGVRRRFYGAAQGE